MLLAAGIILLAGCAYFNTFYNAQKFYAEGLRLKEQNQSGSAKAKFDKAIEKSALVISRWPKSRWVDDALFLVGMSYYQTGQYPRAVRHFDQLLLAFPKSNLVAQAELYRGLALLGDGQYGTARLVLDMVRQKHRHLADIASYQLARSYISREEFAIAFDSLAWFVAHYPRSRLITQAVKELAETASRLQRWQEAERWFTRYWALESDAKLRAEAKLKIAACRFEEGRFAEAVGQIDDVLGRYGDFDDEANLLLGKVLLAQGRTSDALGTWSKVRSSNSYGAEAAFRIGRFHEEQKDFEQARVYYDTAKLRRADSDYGVLAVKRLTLLNAFMGQDTAPQDSAKRLFLRAEVYNLNLGDYDQACLLYQQVADSFPTSPWAPKALLAQAWIVKNVKHDSAAAVPLLKQLIAEYGATEYADEARRWLGLPVPKRKVVKAPAPVEQVAVQTDTIPKPGPEPVSPEEASITESEPRAQPEPGPFPKGRHRPGGRGARERLDEATGQSQLTQPPSSARESVVPLPVRETTAARSEAVPPAQPGLAPVHFDTDRWDIRAGDTAALNQNARRLKQHPELKVVIVGHCDPRGTVAYNLALGQRRADAVKNYLVKAGVPEERLTTRSAGESQPIATSPAEYWQDRRVEFQIE